MNNIEKNKNNQETIEEMHPIIKNIMDGGNYSTKMDLVNDFVKLVDEELINSGRGDVAEKTNEDEELGKQYDEYYSKRVLEEKEKGIFQKGITNSLKKGYLRNALAISLFSDDEIPENFKITKEMIADELANMLPEFMERTTKKAKLEASLFAANNNVPLTKEQSAEWLDVLSAYQDIRDFIKDVQVKYNITLDDYMDKFAQSIKGKNIQPINNTIN